jgi:hypothetical protein
MFPHAGSLTMKDLLLRTIQISFQSRHFPLSGVFSVSNDPGEHVLLSGGRKKPALRRALCVKAQRTPAQAAALYTELTIPFPESQSTDGVEVMTLWYPYESYVSVSWANTDTSDAPRCLRVHSPFFRGLSSKSSQYIFGPEWPLQELESKPANRLPHRGRYSLSRKQNHPAVWVQQPNAPGRLNSIKPTHTDVA